MNEPTFYTTAQLCAALGIGRATLYMWDDATPDLQLGGPRGSLGWSRATIERLAAAHGRTVNGDALG